MLATVVEAGSAVNAQLRPLSGASGAAPGHSESSKPTARAPLGTDGKTLSGTKDSLYAWSVMPPQAERLHEPPRISKASGDCRLRDSGFSVPGLGDGLLFQAGW